MTHPLERIPTDRRTAVFLALLAATLAVWATLATIGAGLATGAAPRGIVSFELARTAADVRRILAWWTPTQTSLARVSLTVDLLFIPLYTTTLAMACLWSRGPIASGGRLAALAILAVPLAWGQWVAGALDLVENAALLRFLTGSIRDPLPLVASGCASLKFLLVTAGSLYALYGAWAARRSASLDSSRLA